MTNGFIDTNSLKQTQYKDSRNLSARAYLHQRFRSNSTGWQQWVFHLIDFPDNGIVLEVGSGPGYLWQQNKINLTNQHILLTDISSGMLDEARASLGDFGRFAYAVHDVCNIPFPESVFDAVVANHMLYHVPDFPQALVELKRVLKPGCCLYAATNGAAHLQEIKSWKSEFFPDKASADWGTSALGFSIENGEELLRQEFEEIQFSGYSDRLMVDEVQPILRYIQSYTQLEDTDPRTFKFRDYIQQQITENGSIQITKESGVFSAVKR